MVWSYYLISREPAKATMAVGGAWGALRRAKATVREPVKASVEQVSLTHVSSKLHLHAPSNTFKQRIQYNDHNEH